MKKVNVNITNTQKVSFEEICKPTSVSKTINRMPTLEAEFKRVFGYDFTPSVLSDMIAECDKKEIKKLFKKIKTRYTNKYYLNIVLTSATSRANIVSKSTRLSISDWAFIDSVMTDTENDKTDTRGLSNFIFFLAFLIYCKNRNISITKPAMTDFSSPIFHVMGNKKWFKDKFCNMFDQLLTEKDIETTLDLFGGSGVLTGYIQDYCSKNNLNLESRYNDLDKNKLKFFKQLTTFPKELEHKCRKLLETYDYYNNKGDTESILKLKENAESLMSQKGLHGAAAFWYVNTTNKNGNVDKQKRKSLEEFAYASELYKKVIFERSNALYRLDKWYNDEKAFILVDPPYPYTLGYLHLLANEDFALEVHVKLYNKLLNAKATWVYFGRTDAPRSHRNNQNKKKLAFDDVQHLSFFDDAFQNKGLFYMDRKVNKNTERIVSNYPFEGFKPYVEETVSPSVEAEETEVTVPSPVEAEKPKEIVPSPVDAEETEVTVSSPVQIEETETVESTVHTESFHAKEIKTDNHETVIEEDTKKEHKECCVIKFFRKLFRCRE
jgi:16S rRNA G966 N2-methylase RsmD